MSKKIPFEGLSNTEIEFLVRRAAFRWYRQWFAALIERWQLHWTIKRLRKLDDRTLCDIGLRRDELHAANFRTKGSGS
jgi:uncharacterized protein YjiS (DUF1127 family)